MSAATGPLLELSEQEYELEEITITAPDGSTRLVIIDRKTGKQYDIQELLEQGVIDQSIYDQYRTQIITLTQFADVITNKAKARSSSPSASPSLCSTTRTITTRMSAATGPSLELSEQEYELEEVTITAPDGSTRVVIIDRKTGKQYDIQELLEQGVIDQSIYDQYRSQRITLTQFADIITSKTKSRSLSSSPSPSLSSTTTTTARMSAATGPSSLSSGPSPARSEQEYEWAEVTITAPDGSTRLVIIDRKTGIQYYIPELLEQGVIDQSIYDQYRTQRITLAQFADVITSKAKVRSSLPSASPPLCSTTRTITRMSAATGPSLEMSEQEYEWEEVTITAPDGSTRLVITDRKTGKQYYIQELLEQGVIDQSIYDQYRTQRITLAQFADIITKVKARSSSASPSLSSTTRTTTRVSAATGPSSMSSSSEISSSSFSQLTTTKTTMVTERSTIISGGDLPTPDSLKHISSLCITLANPVETVGEQDPVGAIFDTETLEKISIMEALNRGLVDTITAQRLLEAQACTGGIVNPANGHRLGIQEASRQGIIDEDMATRLKPAQKAYIGFENVKTKTRMSAALAMKEKWLPYEAGQRFMEFQFVTGGLHDPEMGCRRSIEDALKLGWLDGRVAQRLQDFRHHAKILTCPKSKLKISYKEAMDNCLVEENTGVRMLQASPTSSRGISSPYNVSAPGSAAGSRSGSRLGSRRGSVDLGSPTSSLSSSHHHRTTSYTRTSFSTRSIN